MNSIVSPENATLPLELQAIAESSYEGWVVWLKGDQDPIFESVPFEPKLLHIHDQSRERSYRGTSRRCMDWPDVPKHKVSRIALFFCREVRPNGQRYLQPVMVIDRPPDRPDIVFIQMKMGAIVINTGGESFDGQKRTGISGYKMGWWDPVKGECVLHTITRREHTDEVCVGHPCWPRPLGFGLSPRVVGLRDGDVPSPPNGT